jgi:uncharacterized repeat protein (TIGR01451 family)
MTPRTLTTGRLVLVAVLFALLALPTAAMAGPPGDMPPNITLTKTTSTPTVDAGGVMRFSVKIENTGQGAAYNLVVSDLLPAGPTWTADGALPTGCVMTDVVVAGVTRQKVTCTFTCFEPGWVRTFSVKATTTIAECATYVNTVSATGASVTGAVQVIPDSQATVTCLMPSIKVVKTGDSFAYHGSAASYAYAVTNTGHPPLHDVHVTDDKCPNVSLAPTSKQNDNGNAVLDRLGSDGSTPEVWVFTCSYTLGAHSSGEANPIVNTATARGKDDFDHSVTDTDQHATTLLHPAIGLVKVGPGTARAGARIPYLIAATNTGDVAFPAALVVITDAQCETPPIRVAVGADMSFATLDPGDTWVYGCVVPTSGAQTTVHNVADVEGTDIHGHHATAQASADTVLTTAPAAVLASGDVVATARLRGPTGCVPPTARLIVSGTRIVSVRFTVDGRKAKTVKTADANGRYVYTVKRSGLGTGTHRVRAHVVFSAGSTPKARTLTMTLNRCPTATIKPVFTG